MHRKNVKKKNRRICLQTFNSVINTIVGYCIASQVRVCI